MKTKSYITGLIFVSLLTYSCTSDDDYRVPEVENNDFQMVPQPGLGNQINKKTIDSTTVNFNREASEMYGEPSNPIPPRK